MHPVTPDSPHALAPAQRLRRLEGPVGDFPFYNGLPVALSGWHWFFVLAGVAVGFAALVTPIPWPGGAWGPMIPALLFAAIPLVVLARVAPGHWRVLFGKVGWRELRLMVGFALLNIVVTMGVGLLLSVFAEVASNAAISQLATKGTGELVAFYAKTLPQLLGEELITVLPFLLLMTLLTQYFGTGRKRAIVGAWLVSSLLFGLIHLPTYDWNWVQCILVIGTARMVLTMAWILTKNIWVSTGAHIINDWLLFTVSLLGARLAAQA
jgi:membrane protease YdiL (CAAX protease family)